MNLNAVLKEMVDDIDYGLAGIIISRDGIAVQNYIKSERFSDTETFAVEYSMIVDCIKKSSDSLNIGSIDEVVISASNFTTLIRLINQDYFILLVIVSDALAGRAKFILKNTADR